MKQTHNLSPPLGTPKVSRDLRSTTYVMLMGQFCTKDMCRSSVNTDCFKKVTRKNHIQTILVLGQFFLKHFILECTFKIHLKSKSTNAKLQNLHHILLLMHRTNKRNLNNRFLLICRSNMDIVTRKHNSTKDVRRTSKHTRSTKIANNDRIMNHRNNNSSYCTIRYTNSKSTFFSRTKSTQAYIQNKIGMRKTNT